MAFCTSTTNKAACMNFDMATAPLTSPGRRRIFTTQPIRRIGRVIEVYRIEWDLQRIAVPTPLVFRGPRGRGFMGEMYAQNVARLADVLKVEIRLGKPKVLFCETVRQLTQPDRQVCELERRQARIDELPAT